MGRELVVTAAETPLRAYSHLFIGGEWVEPSSGEIYRSVDPAYGEPWAEIARGDARDVDRAVAAARAALAGPWSELTASRRGALIRRLAELVSENLDMLAELESRDNGKTHRDTLGEVSRAVEWLTFFAGAADKINGATIPVRPDALAYTVREPVGVVACDHPLEFPAVPHLVEARSGPGGGQHHRSEAFLADERHRSGVGGTGGRSGLPRGGRERHHR